MATILTTINKVEIAAGVAAVSFLLWVLLRGCNPAPQTNQKQVDSLYAVIQTQNKQWIAINKADSAQLVDEFLTNDSLKAVLRSTEFERSLLTATNNNLYAELKKARVIHDTPSQFVICDSCFNQLDAMSLQLAKVEYVADTLAKADSSIIMQEHYQFLVTKSLYLKTDSALATTKTYYDGLSKQYGAQVRNNKFNKTLSRIEAAVILVLGGFAYAELHK